METKLLKQVSLFADLRETDLRLIARKMKWDFFPEDSLILMEADEGNSLFIIHKGRVKISRTSQDGKEVILAILKSGDFFGEMSLLDGQARSANVMTIEDSEVLVLRREDFMALIMRYPQISIHLLKALTHRLRQSDAQIKSLSLMNASSKVAAALLLYAEMTGIEDDNCIIIPFIPPQLELASIAGTSRETISRTLRCFLRDGLVKREKSKLVIPNVKEFRKRYL
jgi:CRP/FNR family transcriptional regulator, cyclic AMP receptor protein